MRVFTIFIRTTALVAGATVIVILVEGWLIGAGRQVALGHLKTEVPSRLGKAAKDEVVPLSGYQPSLIGRSMRDEVLIAAVRDRFVQPSSQQTAYNLSDPEQTYFAQNGQDKMVADIFNNKSGGLFLEAGALDGEYLSNTLYLERHLGWTGILVEPNPITFQRLRAKKRRALLLNAGLALRDRATRLSLDLGGNYPELSKFVGPLSPNVAQVDCFPLFTVLAALGHPVLDLLVLDIEGAEFQVLQFVPWVEVRVRLLVVETNKVKEGIPLLEKFLTSQGFKFYRTIGADSVYYHPKHLTKDMILL